MVILPFFLALIVSILIVAGQILWKLALNGLNLNLANFLNLLKSPLFIIGVLSYFFAFILWIYLLNKYPYHLIYPLLSFSFIFSLLAARFILHEEVILWSWIGVFIICLGIIIAGIGFKSL